MKGENLGGRTRANLLANYFGGGWAALMGLVFVPEYIHFLGIDAYGLIGIYASLTVWFSMLDMGFSPTINREMSRYLANKVTLKTIADLLKTVELIYFLISAMIIILVISIAPWLTHHWIKIGNFSEIVVVKSLMIAGVVIAIRWMSTIYRSAILGLQKQVWLNVLTAIMATIRSVGTIIVLAYINNTLEAFFIYQGITYLVEMGILFYTTHNSLPKLEKKSSLNFKLLNTGRNFILGMGAIGVLSTILMQLDKVILSKFVTLANFGYFTLASSVAGSLYILVMPISNVAYPRFTYLVSQNNIPQLIGEYHKFTQVLTIMLTPTATLMIFFSHTIIYYWSGSDVLANNVAPLMSILSVGYLINGYLHVPYMAQLGYGWYKLKLSILAIATPIVIAALYLFVHKFGVIAAAVIWLVLNVIILLVEIPIMHLRILKKELNRWVFKDIIFPLVICLSVYFLADLFLRYSNVLLTKWMAIPLMISLDIIATLAVAMVTSEGRRYFSLTINKLISNNT